MMRKARVQSEIPAEVAEAALIAAVEAGASPLEIAAAGRTALWRRLPPGC